jgi:hypothetical protein
VWLCLGIRRGIGRASSSRPQGLWSAWTWGLAISGPTALAERGTTGLSAPNVLCRHTDLHAVWEAMVAWTIGATLRPSLTRLDLLARLFVCGLAAGVAATTAARAETQEHVYQAEPVGGILRIEGGDSLTARHLAELERRSATGRELLHRVERLPATVLIIRAYPLLVKTTGLYGHSRFWVTDGRLFGYLRYQTESLGNDRPLCIIVHELAHAVELAGVDRREGTKAIREFVLSRALGDDPPDWRGSETEFPRTITHHVWLELLGRLRGPSALDSLALARGVPLPPAQAAQAAPEEPRPSATRSATR